MNIETMPHNGHMLTAVMAERRFTNAQLAHTLKVSPTYIVRLMARPNIKAGDLWKLSNPLGVNLLEKLARLHPIQTPGETEKALQQRVADLEKEVAIYKDLLKSK